MGNWGGGPRDRLCSNLVTLGPTNPRPVGKRAVSLGLKGLLVYCAAAMECGERFSAHNRML